MRESREQNERLVKVITAVAAQLDLVMERKRAAEQLSDTNEILQSILSNMGDAVIVADKDGNFLVFNPAAERMFGKGAMQMPFTEWSHLYGLYLRGQDHPVSAGSIAPGALDSWRGGEQCRDVRPA